MKQTDYAARAAGLDIHLTGRHLYGIEIGCDVGAHAEALLRYCSVDRLILVDVWDNDYYRGYCMGRLQSQGWKNNVDFIRDTSNRAAKKFGEGEFDFIYIDIAHDRETVQESLEDWWPKLKAGGMLGYRNYSALTIQPVIDDFVAKNAINFVVERYHNEIVMFKQK